MLLGEENHSSPVVYRGGMVFLPYRCLSDTLTPVFPFDSFINGLIGECAKLHLQYDYGILHLVKEIKIYFNKNFDF